MDKFKLGQLNQSKIMYNLQKVNDKSTIIIIATSLNFYFWVKI